jgi:hypothetical protein
MLVRLAGCQKATRCEGAGEIIFCCPAHLKHLFAEGRDLLFRFSRAQIFVNAKVSAYSNPTMDRRFTELVPPASDK